MLNKSRSIRRRDGTLSESQLDGALDRFPALQRIEEGKLFRFNAAKVDGEIQTVNRQKNLGGLKLRHGTDFAVFSAFLHGVTRSIRSVISVFHFQKQVVDRIMQFEELHIRLNVQPEPRRFGLIKILGAKRGICQAVEGFNIRPFEANHIENKHAPVAYPPRILAQPGFQLRAQVSKREGTRRTFRQVSLAHGLELPPAEYGSQTRKIFGQAPENTKPVLPVVDFEAFEGSQTVIRLDETSRVSAHASTARRLALHAFRPSEWLHHGAGNGPLESMELHTATASDLLLRKRLAFKASL